MSTMKKLGSKNPDFEYLETGNRDLEFQNSVRFRLILDLHCTFIVSNMAELLILPSSEIIGIIWLRRYEYFDRDLRKYAAHKLLIQRIDTVTSLLQRKKFDFEIMKDSKQIRVIVY